MCGRYLIISSPEAIRRFFQYPEQPNFPARYNVAPTQPIPIVRIAEGRRQFVLVRWGLIPAWVKDPREFSLLINARGESVNDKPAFCNAMKRRRCLIPADGFYEWKDEGGRKRPYVVRPRSGGPIAFAGLWESWMGPNGEEMETAAIITTEASRDVAHIHHRMPVVVPPDAFDLWLDPHVDAETAAALIVPAPAVCLRPTRFQRPSIAPPMIRLRSSIRSRHSLNRRHLLSQDPRRNRKRTIGRRRCFSRSLRSLRAPSPG
jgi:putative SOS response-associated peptidase YedK